MACPHVTMLQDGLTTGDMFVPLDHYNLCSYASGIGANIDRFGPRFYDVSNYYNRDERKLIMDKIGELGIKADTGAQFWVNGATIPQRTHRMIAQGLSNDKFTFKAMTAKAIQEMFAVHHWNAKEDAPGCSVVMVGLVSEQRVAKQSKSEAYAAGVGKLMALVAAWQR